MSATASWPSSPDEMSPRDDDAAGAMGVTTAFASGAAAAADAASLTAGTKDADKFKSVAELLVPVDARGSSSFLLVAIREIDSAAVATVGAPVAAFETGADPAMKEVKSGAVEENRAAALDRVEAEVAALCFISTEELVTPVIAGAAALDAGVAEAKAKFFRRVCRLEDGESVADEGSLEGGAGA